MVQNFITEVLSFSGCPYYWCINCNKEIQHAISESFNMNGLSLSAGFIMLAAIIVVLSYLSTKKQTAHNTAVPLTCAAMVLGMGLGGFADGIVLHQILQWHEMLSNKFPPETLLYKSVNMFWDGIFHAFTLLATIIGVCLLWKLMLRDNINKSGFLLSGGLLTGWGIFNLAEGILNHHILKLHNVREFSPHHDLWNYGFLLFGVTLILAGWLFIRRGKLINSV